jgi:hypothetical protein
MAATLINKTVRLSEEQIAGLHEEGQRDRREFSELVRIAVDELLAARKHVKLTRRHVPMAKAHKDNGR